MNSLHRTFSPFRALAISPPISWGLVTLLLAASLAGCVTSAFDDEGDPVTPGATGEALDSEPRPPVSEFFEGRLTAEARNLGFPTALGESTTFPFAVSPDVLSVIVELRWTPSGQDLDLVVFTPRFCEDSGSVGFECSLRYYALEEEQPGVRKANDGMPLLDSGYARVVFDAQAIETDGSAKSCGPRGCTWSAYVTAKAAADVAYEVAATVFVHEEPPVDYSAFED